MAEDTRKTEAAAEGKKGSGKLKAIIIVAAVLMIEGLTIVGTMMLSGGPSEAQGEGIAKEAAQQQNQIVEALLIDDVFENHRTGRPFRYDTEIYVKVRQKNLDQFKEELEAMKNQVRVDVGVIFSRAEPGHFQEPTRATLTRQVKAMLDERFGEAADGEPVIEGVLIAKCMGFRGDY
jgi:flagellar basal body-associated protein FliL